jgi:hypothetical protein
LKKAVLSDKGKSVAAICERCSREIRINPVCSEEGVTYESECQCACQNDGVCPKYADGPCPSFDQVKDKCEHCKKLPIDPVCGNDYRTYDNLCYLQCNGRALYKKGNCDSFGKKQNTAFDMRSNKFMGNGHSHSHSHSHGSYQSQLDHVTSEISKLSQRAKRGQQVDPNTVASLMNMLKAIKAMKH